MPTYIQDLAKERSVLADLLKRPEEGGSANVYGKLGKGTDVNAALASDPALRSLVQEQVYQRAYGTATPTFAATRKSTESPTGSTQNNAAYEYGSGIASPAVDTSTNNDAATQSGYGSALLDAINARFPQTNLETNQDTLYQQELARVQDQVDAINALYDAQVAQEQERGRGREGQTLALNTVSGTQFSPFGTAQREQTRSNNQEIINAINAQRAADISGLYGGANTAAREQAQANLQLAQSSASDYINAISQAYGISMDEASAAANAAYQRAALTGMYGGDKTLALQQFLADQGTQAADSSRADAYLQIAQQQAAQQNLDLVQGGDGNYYTFNPQTGESQIVGGIPGTPTYSSSGDINGGLTYADLLADPLTRDALTAYESAAGAGSINNLSAEDLMAIRSIYGSRTGNQSLADPSSVFTQDTGGGSYLDYLNP